MSRPVNPTYAGTAYGNQKQMVLARRRHPLIEPEPKSAGDESCRLRPEEEWIGVPVPAIVLSALFTQARERLRRAGGGDSVRGAAERGRAEEGCMAITPSKRPIGTYLMSNRMSTAILTGS
jgi:hypothetical protein